MPTEAPDLLIQEYLSRGSLGVFVGAGLSIGAGLPSWYRLIGELAQRVGQELPPSQWASGDTLIDAAQYYINREGLHSLIMFLRDRLDTTGVQPTEAHRTLARLPISMVFTANYDNLLELAYHDAGKRVNRVIRDQDIAFMLHEPGTVNIIKLYGDLEEPDTIVLARQQYESFFLERAQMIKLLETELISSTMLYLGWSHTDPHFNLVFGELMFRYGPHMRPGYAVLFDLPPAQQLELQRKQIHMVSLPDGEDSTAQLATWLKGL